jgi:hypothetical protein
MYTHLLTVRGRTMSLAGWAEEVNLSWHTLAKRLRSGWSPERAVTEPLRSYKSHPGVSGAPPKHKNSRA